MKSNKIPVICSFCKDTFVLSWIEREHVCTCGVRYFYTPNQGKPLGKGYAKRYPKKENN